MARYVHVFVGMTVAWWVYDVNGEIVTFYSRKADAVAHAGRIGGTWRRGRL